MNLVLKRFASLIAVSCLAAPAGAACINPTVAKAVHVGELEAVLSAGELRCARAGAGFPSELAAYRAASAAAFADAGVRLGQRSFQRSIEAKAAAAAPPSCAELRRLARTGAASQTLEELVQVARTFGVVRPSDAVPCGDVLIAAR